MHRTSALPLRLCASLFLLTAFVKAAEPLIFEDGAGEPLSAGLEFHHGSWKFGDGAMIGEQVPTEKHLATIKGLIAFDRMQIEWKMKFIEPKQNFLFVTWPSDSHGHAMDFTFVPDTGKFAIVRPGSKEKPSAVLTEGQLTELTKVWHEIACIHDGPNFTVTIDGVTITAADESFNRDMGPFYLNGGGFNGAKFLVKDLKVTALPGSPQARPFLFAETKQSAAPAMGTYHAAPGDRVLADFESSDFGDWITRGEAFGAGPETPAAAKNKPALAIGKALANSFRPNDKTTGTLTSPPFTIDRKYLHFLIGGGPHNGKTCVNLLIDGKSVRTTTGCGKKNKEGLEIMNWETWDLTEFQGKSATLQVVDAHTGGWGHIQVDHPVLSDLPLEKKAR